MYKMCFFKAAPVTVVSKMQGPSAEVQNGGTKVDQPICNTTDAGDGKPVWTALIEEAKITLAFKAESEFLGVGLDEVKTKFPVIYGKVAMKSIQVEINDPMNPDKKITVTQYVTMETALKPGEVLVETDLAPQTFSGFDPKTGGAADKFEEVKK